METTGECRNEQIIIISGFHILTTVAFGALCAAGGTAQAQFKQTNMVSDIPGFAAVTDPNLINRAFPTFREPVLGLERQGTGTSTLYTVTGNASSVAPANFFPPNSVAIPAPGPTGQVANPGASFRNKPHPRQPNGTPAAFVHLNGAIYAWVPRQ